MKNLILFFFSLILIYSCNSDDTETAGNDDDDIENLVYSETIDGDLSNNNTSPTLVTFTAGNNVVVAEQNLENPDYFIFLIPEGYELSQINVAANLLGGLVYGETNIGSNILPEMGTLSEAIGFTGALASGEYTIWLNQTGETSKTTLNFVLTMVEIIEVELENVVYNESTDGDLSNNGTMPTSITFAAGSNIIIAEQASTNPDYFTFVVPEGYELSQIHVENFDTPDVAFIGIENGTSINGETADNLLGGFVYGEPNINTNILPAMGALTGATGFMETLPAGNYTIWLNQTGTSSNTTLDFVINMSAI